MGGSLITNSSFPSNEKTIIGDWLIVNPFKMFVDQTIMINPGTPTEFLIPTFSIPNTIFDEIGQRPVFL
jgi:hypothetical protein